MNGAKPPLFKLLSTVPDHALELQKYIFPIFLSQYLRKNKKIAFNTIINFFQLFIMED